MPILRIPTLILSFALAITACTHRAPAVDTEPATATEASASPQLTCGPGTRQCVGCNGGTFCAVRCPECAPPVAPDEGNPADNTVADLTPVGEACGGSICKPGLTCCNPSCGTCVPKGVECTQQTCN